MKRENPAVTEAQVQKRWAAMDFNKDGSVSRKEFVQAEDFAAIDTDSSGTITIDELRASMKRENPAVTEAQVHRRWAAMDFNKDGSVSRKEFVQAEDFAAIDTDSSGTITFNELREAMKRENPAVTEAQVQRRWAAMDFNKDGSVSRKEFVQAEDFA